MVVKIFRGEYKNLAKIGKFVVSQAKKAGLTEKDIYNVQLAVDEACTNIIEHAYGGEGIGDIECDCVVSHELIKIVLTDRGSHFNPDSVPDPNVGVPLKKFGPRGAGLYLIKNLMDEIKFEFSDHGTRLSMVKTKTKL